MAAKPPIRVDLRCTVLSEEERQRRLAKAFGLLDKAASEKEAAPPAR
jgi:hypothetical protein